MTFWHGLLFHLCAANHQSDDNFCQEKPAKFQTAPGRIAARGLKKDLPNVAVKPLTSGVGI